MKDESRDAILGESYGTYPGLPGTFTAMGSGHLISIAMGLEQLLDIFSLDSNKS